MASEDDIRPDVTPEPKVASAASEPAEKSVRERGVYTKIQRAGFELAQTTDIEPEGGGVWTVGDCIVNFPRKEGTCKAFRKSRPRTRCTHWWAVAYTVDPPTPDELTMPTQASEVAPPAAPPLPLVSATTLPTSEEVGQTARARVKGGYTRYAADYDRSLRKEYRDTMFFMRSFLPNIAPALETREQKRRGRKMMPLWLLLFEALVHAHHNWSFRRTEGVLDFLADPEIGFLPGLPGFNVVDRFVCAPETTPILRDLVAITAEPFREYGPMTVAADGTGASSNRFDDWRVEGKGRIEARETRRWYKAHAACDVDTFTVVAVYVTDKDVSEKRVLIDRIIPELVARGYDVEKFLADGGYNATEIRDLIVDALGAEPYIPWGANSKRAISLPWRHKVKHAALIERIHEAFKTDEGARFKAEYRYRVKVEDLFSSIKTKFGGSVRAQHGAGPENEILLKCICHNVQMLLMAARIYGLDITGLTAGAAA